MSSFLLRGTRVATPDGPRPIEGLRVGDLVYSWSLLKRRPVLRPVSDVARSSASALLRIKAGTFIIEGVAPACPFYDDARSRWVTAEALTPHSRLIAWLPRGQGGTQSADPRTVRLALRTSRTEAPAIVHDLLLEGDEQCFFANGLLVQAHRI